MQSTFYQREFNITGLQRTQAGFSEVKSDTTRVEFIRERRTRSSMFHNQLINLSSIKIVYSISLYVRKTPSGEQMMLFRCKPKCSERFHQWIIKCGAPHHSFPRSLKRFQIYISESVITLKGKQFYH